MDLQLDRMHAALHELDHPCRSIPAIQVLGTNGKGSIVSFLESALCAAGLRCGVTTSPHLVSWCERIRIQGKAIDVETLRSQLQALQPLSERHRLTPFELLVTAAFSTFQRHACELLLLEVGLGGRLDATTAHPCRPVVAVASIGLDHCEHLGNSLTAIATEKAAAIPPQATVISCAQDPAVQKVLEATCKSQQANLRWVKPLDSTWQLGIPGAIQRSNAAVALGALQALSGLGWSLPEFVIQEGFATARWPGRLQTVHWGGPPATPGWSPQSTGRGATGRRTQPVERRSQRCDLDPGDSGPQGRCRHDPGPAAATGPGLDHSSAGPQELEQVGAAPGSASIQPPAAGGLRP